MIEDAFRNTHSHDAEVFMKHLPVKMKDHFAHVYQHYQTELSSQNFHDLVQAIPEENR